MAKSVKYPFTKGDRVAIYLPRGRFVGQVTLTPYMPYILVAVRDNDQFSTVKIHRVHPKQCRKLIKKRKTK